MASPTMTDEAATPTSKAEVTTPLPSLMVLPWQNLAIDPDILRITRQTQREASLRLIQTVTSESADLAVMAPRQPNYEGARRQLASVFATNSTIGDGPLAIIPLWTKLHDHELIALVVIDSQRNTIKTISHRLLPKSFWEDNLKNGTLNQFFSDTLQDLAGSIDLKAPSYTNEDLAVILRTEAFSRRRDEIDRLGLSVILASKLMPNVTFINPLATELLTTIHGFYGQKNTMRRANREVIVRATYEKPPLKLGLPIDLKLNIRATDAVFGKTLPWSWTETLTINARPETKEIELTFSDRLTKELAIEGQALKRQDLPQTAKIRGAWAYVDKGRAWGLQMNDRLVDAGNPSLIKGHVVGYFGPELKLMSPRGWPIHEGAIVFIRKGQNNVKPGTTFTYDTMKVPSPWPPNAASVRP